MSLLDSDDFSYYGAKVVVSGQQQAPDNSSSTVEDSAKRSRQADIESQRSSTFSLRKKKDSDGRTHKKNKSQGKIVPPDSPKGRTSGPSPNTKSSKKQYAHLLENEDSSDDEEDDTSSTFVLSRGQQAREKRGSIKSSSRDSTGLVFEGGFTSHARDNTPPKPILASNMGQANFPVFFTPPPDPILASERDHPLGGTPTGGSNLDFILGLDKPSHTPTDPIPTLPPPPVPHVVAPPTNTTGYQLMPTEPEVPQTTPTDPNEWAVSDELFTKCSGQFRDICGEDRIMSGDKARDFFLKSNLPVKELSKIWKLSDTDGDGSLTVSEFTIAMKLVLMRRKNYDIPTTLPPQLKVPSSTSHRESSVPSFNFPPPPPPHVNKTQPTSTAIFNPEPTVTSSLPLFSNTLSKTEPTTAISEVQPSSIDHIPPLLDNIPHPHPDADISDILSASFMSAGDMPLLLDSINVSIDSSVKEPAVNRLLSSLGGEESTGDDEDETCNLVTPSGGENPVVKPRKKKRAPQPKPILPTDLHRSKTVSHSGRGSYPPPPRPPPYQKRSVSPPTTNQLIESSDRMTTPSPHPDTSDILPMISPRPTIPPKPVIKTEKGHGRSTSWDLSKMLKEDDDMRFHDDVPAAEPPKIPPRRKKDEDSYHSDEDEGRKPDKLATPLQRSASTGSLASTGVPSNILPMKSRTSSVESGTLLVDGSTHLSSIGGRSLTVTEPSLPRTSTINRRPAPAPPPNKPKKPMYPPSFKKVVVDTSNEAVSSLSDALLSEDSLQSAEVYQKKSKSELQKSIKRLKEENAMYSNLNNELSKKLNEMRQERSRLEAHLNEELKSY